MSRHKHSRRSFLGNAAYGCASIGATTLFSTWTNMGPIGAAAAANRPLINTPCSDNNYKA